MDNIEYFPGYLVEFSDYEEFVSEYKHLDTQFAE